MKYAKDIKLAIIYLKQHKLLASLTVFILVVATVLEGLCVGMMVPILQSLMGDEKSNFFINYVQSIFSAIHVEYNFTNLMLFFGSSMLLKFGIVAIQQYLIRAMTSIVAYEFREKAFNNLMSLPLSYYYGQKVGDIIATLYTSSQNAGATIGLFIQLLVELFFIMVYMTLNLIISVPLTLITCMLTGISYFFIMPKFKKGFEQGREEKDIIDNTLSFLVDKLNGIKTVKAFNNEKFHTISFTKLATDFKRIQIKIQLNRILSEISLEPLVFALIVGLMIFSIELLHMPVIYLLSFFFIFSRIIPRVKLINDSYLNIMNYLPHFSKIQKIIDKHDKVYLPTGTRRIETLQHGIEFQGVYFRYPASDEYAIKNVNLFIEKNKTTALIGESGGGKTTIADLILRHHDPEKGIIRIDGIDLREIRNDELHQFISMVEQDAYLFNDTIYNNIIYGKFNADEDELIQAAKLANAHDFIQSLPDKYNTLVGERGMKLSGGQKQRIVLARGLIRNPEILILDEATSALDSESERLIQDSINRVKKEKTIIIIAHRLSTIADADKIVVIENGGVAEEGNHDALLEKGLSYKKYYNLQFRSKG
jgi:subfamily B ATP-binding cassette protein MsbA